MTKTLKLLSLLLLVFFSNIFAESKTDFDRYRLYVAKVDPEFHCFALSNGMVCYTVKKRWESETLPEVGAEIYLIPRLRLSRTRQEKVQEGEFYAFFSDQSSKRSLTVWSTPEFLKHCPSYVSAKIECTQPAGWWSYAVHELVIELSDGSKWITNKIPDFDPGSTVLITADHGSDKWFIINLSGARFLEKNRVSMVYYDQVEVRPYLAGGG